ncbi:MAG: trypsin-like peptidase domain-containing protein [Acidobacteria bacterium]|nr:trypsin-like peptidase domain-containing protein [Acidobacteriota bacterium]
MRTLFIFLGSLLACFAQDSVPDMLENVLPAVVTVVIPKEAQYSQGAGLAGADQAYAKMLDVTGMSGGSGFLIERGGKPYVVTNAHVVRGATGTAGSIEAISIDQTHYPMKLAALDSLYDLAVLEFDGGSPGPEMKMLRFRAEEVRVGESVYAVGNPLLEFPYSVSSGIVGGKNRRHPDLTGKFGFIQSSATTTWGNSGGPLVDSKGRVAGVVTKIQFHPMGNQLYQQTQINLALDSRIALKLVERMLAGGGRLRRAYLGLEITEDVTDSEPHRQASPPAIAGTVAGSPARKALESKKGYRVLRIGKIDVASAADALEAFEAVQPGDTVAIEIGPQKSDQVEIVKVVAGELTDANAAAIGQYVLAKAGRIAAEREGGIVLRRSSGMPESNASVVVRSLPTRRKAAGAATAPAKMPSNVGATSRVPPEGRIVAAGLYDDDGTRMYRVRNTRDLGVAVKITAMSGLVDVLHLPEGESDPLRLAVSFSDKPDLLRRTLLY